MVYSKIVVPRICRNSTVESRKIVDRNFYNPSCRHRRRHGRHRQLRRVKSSKLIMRKKEQIGNDVCAGIGLHLSRLLGQPTRWFLNRSDTNLPVQAQKQVRSLKFWIYKVKELYYPCSENKGADQLRSYCEADQRLCFRLFRVLVFPCGGSFEYIIHCLF